MQAMPIDTVRPQWRDKGSAGRTGETGDFVMRKFALLATLLVVGLTSSAAIADDHIAVTADQLKWAPAPPVFPKGAQIAVVAGDPSKEGLYVFRLKLPAGYKVPPHVHPQDENITVISGTFSVGMGDKFDDKKGTALKTGGFAKMPKGMQHYAYFTEETIIQL